MVGLAVISLDSVKDFKVLVVGDGIMDRYQYVKPVGKAVKEPALSVHRRPQGDIPGRGVGGSAHCKDFVTLVDSPRLRARDVNTRLVDDTYLRKLIVTHELVKNPPKADERYIRDYDLVIVTDFGHGTMTPELIARISREARYLAVNAQTNSTNFGFNLITKYPRADFVVLDELEARLAAHDKDSPIEDVILKLGDPIGSAPSSRRSSSRWGRTALWALTVLSSARRLPPTRCSIPWARATPSSAWLRRSLLPALR
jgi:hypothetical protein